VSSPLHGPWTYIAVTDQVCTQPSEGRPHGAVVASIGHHPGFISKCDIGPVVAAAPDLLAALKVLNVFAKAAIERVGLTDTNRICEAADAAIAKAEGVA